MRARQPLLRSNASIGVAPRRIESILRIRASTATLSPPCRCIGQHGRRDSSPTPNGKLPGNPYDGAHTARDRSSGDRDADRREEPWTPRFVADQSEQATTLAGHKFEDVYISRPETKTASHRKTHQTAELRTSVPPSANQFRHRPRESGSLLADVGKPTRVDAGTQRSTPRVAQSSLPPPASSRLPPACSSG